MPSGWLTLVCLFLPSFRFCSDSDPVPMLILTPIWPLVLGGAVIAFAAAAATAPALRERGRALLSFVALSVTVTCVLIGYSLVARSPSHVLAIALVAGGVGVAVVSAKWREPSELAVAAVALCVAALHVVLCSLVAFDPNSAWGAIVSAVVACGLCAGTLWWTAEAARARRRRAA